MRSEGVGPLVDGTGLDRIGVFKEGAPESSPSLSPFLWTHREVSVGWKLLTGQEPRPPNET